MLSLYLAMIESEEHKLTFEHIYNNYAKQMQYIANNILQDPYIAEDAVQEALFNIARFIDCVPTHTKSATKAYVYIVIRNISWKMLKDEKKWRSYIDISTLPLRTGTDLFDRLIQSEDYHMLLELIRKLPDPYKDVLYLRYVAEIKPQQIGIVLSRKTSTVQQQLCRAKKMLEDMYKKEGNQHGR